MKNTEEKAQCLHEHTRDVATEGRRYCLDCERYLLASEEYEMFPHSISYKEAAEKKAQAAQLLVDRLVEEAMLPRGEKRLLHSKNEWGCEARQKLGIARGAMQSVQEAMDSESDSYKYLEKALMETAMPELCSIAATERLLKGSNE